MKVIGLIGGMSWESTAVYYQLLNQAAATKSGGLCSASIRIHSFDFEQIVKLQMQGRWDKLADLLSQAAKQLEVAGSSCIAICTNTMHKVADEVRASVSVPLIDIRDSVGQEAAARGYKRVGLLGTRYTMEQEFLKNYLCEHWDLETVVPSTDELHVVHSIIFDELCQGVVRPQSRVILTGLIEAMANDGAEAVVLGCTELMLLLEQKDSVLPILDSTTLHARALTEFAMGEPALIASAN